MNDDPLMGFREDYVAVISKGCEALGLGKIQKLLFYKNSNWYDADDGGYGKHMLVLTDKGSHAITVEGSYHPRVTRWATFDPAFEYEVAAANLAIAQAMVQGLSHGAPPAPVRKLQNLSSSDVVVIVDGVRFDIGNGGYGVMLTCARASGWRLYSDWDGRKELIGGEFDSKDFRIEIADQLVCGKERA